MNAITSISLKIENEFDCRHSDNKFTKKPCWFSSLNNSLCSNGAQFYAWINVVESISCHNCFRCWRVCISIFSYRCLSSYFCFSSKHLEHKLWLQIFSHLIGTDILNAFAQRNGIRINQMFSKFWCWSLSWWQFHMFA